jgi:two-component system phosphate regulon sensor histidine kinase PhoR
MYAETLEMGRVTEDKKKEYYAIIGKETSRLTRIVSRILNFSQIEANKKRYHFESVQLNVLCDDIVTSYFAPLKDKDFTFDFVKDESLPQIQGDKESLTEAIMNLLDNAVKYSKDNKHITIKTGTDQKYSYVEVKDEGIGIARNHQQEIFNQFYRVPTGDVHNTKGSGLGLTLVKKTVEAHLGKIKVESSPGKGSTFRLHFPVK